MTQGQGFLQQLGNYKLVRVIGQGGFATVYLGRHVHLKSYAAVKVLQVSTQVDLFRREAQTIMDLTHPNIVGVLDFGVQNDIAFIVMDYAPYGSLQMQYRLGTVVPLDAVLSYVKQAASALQYAHNHRIIHRDVKPPNLLVGKQYAILLTDFGIALLAESSRNTRTWDAAGTIAYIAPEQIRGKPQPASDQYALAVTVYEWLCGTRPFRGTLAEIAAQHLSSPPPSLRSHNPLISLNVENVVLQALAKDPLGRFPSIQEFADALENAAGILPRRASQESFVAQNMVNTTSNMVIQPHVLAGQGRRRSPHLSRRTVLLVLGVAGVSGAAGIVFISLHSSSSSQALIQTHPIATEQTSKPTIAPTTTSTSQPTPTQQQIQTGTIFTTYQGHTGIVYSVAWSPDGTRLVSGADDNTVQVWNSAGSKLAVYSGHTSAVVYVSWSPDGKQVASASNDNTVKVWDVATDNLLFTCSGHTNNVHSAVWSPDGTRLASGSGDSTVRLWNARTGNPVTTYRDHTSPVWDIAWSPDGTKIASASGNDKAGGSDNTVKIWNVNTGATTLTYTGHTNSPVYVAWSSDGKRIASGSFDTTVQIWNAVTGNTQLIYRGHNNRVYGVSWSPGDRYIASGSVDTTVQLWEANTGNNYYTFRGHSSIVFGVVWSPRNTLIASASSDKTVQVWQA